VSSFPFPMGVKNLWPILDCSGEITDLSEFQGKTVAVDLAGWVVQGNMCRAMQGQVAKPHLRNTFARASGLILRGVKPVFVLDGAAPELKRATMETRLNAERGAKEHVEVKSVGRTRLKASRNDGKFLLNEMEPVEVKSLSRPRLKASMNECKFLLNAMGVLCVQARGEGEAACAKMDKDGNVDAVITEDSDAFCYGARTVLRNFGVNASASAVSAEKFVMSKIERSLGLDRNREVMHHVSVRPYLESLLQLTVKRRDSSEKAMQSTDENFGESLSTSLGWS
jgi:flap endonuclease GEN